MTKRILKRWRMGQENGCIVPLLTVVFKIFKCVSPLTIVARLVRLFHKSWEPSPVAVDIYVLIWCFFLIFLACLVATIQSFSLVALTVISAILVWRLLDISQSWFNIFLRRKVEVVAPVRSLVLAVINYLELWLIFGLLSFLFRYGNFYPPFETITQSLRHSIGVITTMGSGFDPASVGGALLYYFEIAFGLGFLIVIISRVLSLFRDDRLGN